MNDNCLERVLWVSCIFIFNVYNGQALSNVYCAPHQKVVAVDSDYRFFPYMVVLSRCQGSIHSFQPTIRKCVPDKLEYVNVSVTDLTKITSQHVTLKVANHMSCKSKCVKEEKDCNSLETYQMRSCRCQCNYQSEPRQGYCKKPFVWKQSECGCVCGYSAENQKCGDKKIWNQEQCGCRCQQKYFDICIGKSLAIDTRSCLCLDSVRNSLRNSTVAGRTGDDGGGVSVRVLAVALVLELIIIGIIVGVAYFYCCRKNGKEKCSKDCIKPLFFSRKGPVPQKKIKVNLYPDSALKGKDDYDNESTSTDPTIYTLNTRQEIMEVDGSNRKRDLWCEPITSSQDKERMNSLWPLENDCMISKPYLV